MKAGSFITFHSLRFILAQAIHILRPITLLLTPDEEVGSPTSRALIEQEGAASECVLIREPAAKDGSCITARRGVGRFTLHLTGVGARAGSRFTEGASAVVDLARQIERIHAMLDLEPFDPRCAVRVEGGMNRPPMQESPANLALYERARSLAGFQLGKQHRGGGSDGNFTAALGVPTLDGLGCPGDGAHASHEHIQWRHLAPRAALLPGLLETL